MHMLSRRYADLTFYMTLTTCTDAAETMLRKVNVVFKVQLGITL